MASLPGQIIVGNHIVMETVPDECGRMRIKVGSLRDELSITCWNSSQLKGSTGNAPLTKK